MFEPGARKGKARVSGKTWPPSWGKCKDDPKPVGELFAFRVIVPGKVQAQLPLREEELCFLKTRM